MHSRKSTFCCSFVSNLILPYSFPTTNRHFALKRKKVKPKIHELFMVCFMAVKTLLKKDYEWSTKTLRGSSFSIRIPRFPTKALICFQITVPHSNSTTDIKNYDLFKTVGFPHEVVNNCNVSRRLALSVPWVQNFCFMFLFNLYFQFSFCTLFKEKILELRRLWRRFPKNWKMKQYEIRKTKLLKRLSRQKCKKVGFQHSFPPNSTGKP